MRAVRVVLVVAELLGVQFMSADANDEWVFERNAYVSGPTVDATRRQLARATSGRWPPSVHIINYRDQELERSLILRGYVDTSTALFEIRQNGTANLYVIEGLATRRGAAIRVRSGQDVRTEVIRGKDPFILEAGSLSHEVVYVGHFSAKPIVFIRSKHGISQEMLTDIDRGVQEQFGESTVHVRNDACFIGTPTYPSINPFAGPLPRGSCEGFWKVKAGWCRTSRGREGRDCEITGPYR